MNEQWKELYNYELGVINQIHAYYEYQLKNIAAPYIDEVNKKRSLMMKHLSKNDQEILRDSYKAKLYEKKQKAMKAANTALNKIKLYLERSKSLDIEMADVLVDMLYNMLELPNTNIEFNQLLPKYEKYEHIGEHDALTLGSEAGKDMEKVITEYFEPMVDQFRKQLDEMIEHASNRFTANTPDDENWQTFKHTQLQTIKNNVKSNKMIERVLEFREDDLVDYLLKKVRDETNKLNALGKNILKSIQKLSLMAAPQINVQDTIFQNVKSHDHKAEKESTVEPQIRDGIPWWSSSLHDKVNKISNEDKNK